MKDSTRSFLLWTALGMVAAAFFLTGCTVQQQHPGQAVTAAKQTAAAARPSIQAATVQPEIVQSTPSPAPVEVVQNAPIEFQPIIHYVPEPPPPAPRPERTPLQRVQARRPVEVMGPGGRTVVYEPGKKITLTCSEFGTLTIKFPAGERIQKFSSGNTGEWMIEQASMGIALPIGVLAIRRAPYAASTELQVITDAAVYQFLLLPQGNGVSSKQASLFTVVNPETEARRAEHQAERMEVIAQQRREHEIKAPQIDVDHLRTYEIGGDHVAWKPVRVVGDHQHTVIQLPPASGAGQPTLTVIEYGKEMRVNTRTLPEENGMGPRIIVDQPFSEARLIGDGGTVSIVGGN